TDMLAFTLRKKKKFMVETDFSEADIFFRKLDDEADSLIEFKWKDMPENVSTAHPAFANNGNRMYFTSNMDDGYGGSDLYYSDFKDGKWSKPVNLGETINTKKHDVFPVVDGDTILYYSSDGLPGYGNLDIFKTKITGDELSRPVNMKAPVNSIGNDFSYYKTDEYTGYLTSNRSDLSQGLNDIFRHERPEPVIEEPEEEELEEPEEILVFNPENFQPHPVFFDINKKEIDKVFYDALDQIADTLKLYDDLSLRLTGHADAKGPSSFSTDLAEKRAAAVKNYLKDKGIKPDKLITDNAGVTKDRNVEGITYHVQIGTSTKDDATDWYAGLIDHSHKITSFEKGQYTLYAIGNFKSKDKAFALKKEIEDTYNIDPLVICSSKDKLLTNCYYALNRRVEFSWIK
ncbi:MAG: OmpA family protein, partial [Bacteroidales bacterium]